MSVNLQKNCQFCKKQYTGCTAKNTCYGCYGLIKKYGTHTPEHFNRKCEVCNTSGVSHNQQAKEYKIK